MLRVLWMCLFVVTVFSADELVAQNDNLRFYKFLLHNDLIPGELNLAGDQIDQFIELGEKVSEIDKEYFKAALRASRGQDNSLKEKGRLDYIKKMRLVETDIQETLLPHQFKRFNQMVLRFSIYSTEGRNVDPVLSPSVGIDLSVNQKSSIKSLLSEREKERIALVKKMKLDLAALDKKYDDKVLGELTHKQKQVFNEKLGPSVDFTRSTLGSIDESSNDTQPDK